MKILILSANTGGGHNAAASAMREYFASRDVEVEIRDALAFRYQAKSDIISHGHVLVYKKAPKLFGAGYRFFEQHPPKKGQSSMMYDTLKSDAKKLHDFLCENSFDLILCTHLFASMIVTEAKKKYAVSIPHHLIITDYTCYPGVNESHADRIYIPHASLTKEFEECGIALSRIVPSGIPVRASFYHKEDAAAAKRALGLPEERRLVLMMCGSMGCGPLPALAALITEKLPEDAMLAVICGSNKKLYDRFSKMKQSDKMHIVGFTDKVSAYMDAADVILTKPGGLSATEAATKGLPMVLIDAVPGCESKNMEFFLQNGFAVTAEGAEALAALVTALLQNEEQKAAMTARLHAEFSAYAAETIGEAILSEVQYIHG